MSTIKFSIVPIPDKPGKRFRDLTNMIFGRLEVHSFAGIVGRAKWNCICKCGTERPAIIGFDLISGKTTSCGCYNREMSSKASMTHGHTAGGDDSPTFRSYLAMMQRCFNQNGVNWNQYGGRSITVCERWVGDCGFKNFLEDMNERPPKMTIERKDNNLGYSPENCRWATRKEQSRNMRTNRIIEYDGELMCLAAFAEKFGICQCVLARRLNLGWEIERALKTPVKNRKLP